jgi:hypothetical protein
LNTPTDIADPATTPPGWYPDPLGRVGWRYWDGAQWAPYGSPDGTGVVVDADQSLAPPRPTAPDPHRLLTFLASTIVLGLVAGAAIWLAGDDDAPSLDRASVAAPSAGSGHDSAASTVPAPPDPTNDASSSKASGADGGTLSPDPIESNWPISGEPLKVIYLVETSRGEQWTEIVASDPPRSISRTDEYLMYIDGIDYISCTEVECVNQGPAEAGADYLTMRIGFAPPTGAERPFTRRIAGREATCTTTPEISTTTCWDTQTGVLLLLDPGDEAMEPSVFTSSRITATYLGPPDPTDFELPHEVVPFEPSRGAP